jgi:hypothetical protein
MAIASFGGLIIDSKGNRSYPGSGGYVGGLSGDGQNYATMLGAGYKYNIFTPTNETIPSPAPTPCHEPFCGEPSPAPQPFPYPGDLPQPTPAPSPTPTPTDDTPDTPEPFPNYPPTCTDCGELPDVPPVPGETIIDIIRGLITPSPKTSITTNPPVYLFTPNQGGGGGLEMKSIIILGVLALGAWYVYKRFAS